MKGKEKKEEIYQCLNCGWTSRIQKGEMPPDHCPNCLCSIHNEDEEGNECGGILEPVGIWVRKNGEWAVIHRCVRCGKISSNRVAADDNPMKLTSLAMRPFGKKGGPYPGCFFSEGEL